MSKLLKKGNLVSVWLGSSRGVFVFHAYDAFYRAVDPMFVVERFPLRNGDVGVCVEDVVPLPDYPGEEKISVYFAVHQRKLWVPVEILDVQKR